MNDLTKFKNWLLLCDLSKNTISVYMERLTTFFQQYEEFNQENIDAFLISVLEKNLAKSTFNGYRNAFIKYGRFIKSDIEFPKNKIPNKELRPYIKEEQLEEMIEKMHWMVSEPDKYKALCSLMFYSGLRIEEVMRLKRKDIKFDELTVFVKESKGKESRVCPITKETVTLLKVYYLVDREDINAFNTNSASVRQCLYRIGKQLGYDFSLHPHTFRHSACHFWLKHTNNNYHVVQKIMGHKDIQTIILYSKITNSEAMEIIKDVLKKRRKK